MVRFARADGGALHSAGRPAAMLGSTDSLLSDGRALRAVSKLTDLSDIVAPLKSAS